LLSDFWPHGAVAEKYGVLRPEGYTERAIFIINEAGYITYIDIHDIDEQPDNLVLFNELKKMNPGYVEVEESPADLPHGGIVMYCTKWCPDCRRARAWLAEKGLAYTEVNIMSTPGADKQVRQWAGGSLVTPTFDIDGKIVVDFNAEQLEAVLKEAETGKSTKSTK
jgi:glutaredoxin